MTDENGELRIEALKRAAAIAVAFGIESSEVVQVAQQFYAFLTHDDSYVAAEVKKDNAAEAVISALSGGLDLQQKLDAHRVRLGEVNADASEAYRLCAEQANLTRKFADERDALQSRIDAALLELGAVSPGEEDVETIRFTRRVVDALLGEAVQS